MAKVASTKDNDPQSLGDDLAAITEERDLLKAENIELKKQLKNSQDAHTETQSQLNALQSAPKEKSKSVKSKTLPEEKLVHLEKGEGSTLETNTLTEAAWNNLPVAHKKGWRVKTPDEIKSNS